MSLKRVSGFLLILVNLSSTVTVCASDAYGAFRYDNNTFKYTGEHVYIKDSVDLMTIEDILTELNAQRGADVPVVSDILANKIGSGGKLPESGQPQDGTIYGDTPKYTPTNMFQGDEDAVNEAIMAQMRSVNIPWGAKKNAVLKHSQYDDIIAEFVVLRNQTSKTKLSVALVKAMIHRESGFKEGAIPGKMSNGVIKEGGYGLMQIEFGPSDGSKTVHEKAFKDWVEGTLGKTVTDVRVDALNPYYNIGFGTLKLSQKLDRYPGDYCKALQAYNYDSLEKLIQAYGEDGWLENRKNAWKVFGDPFGTGRYGDMKYIEHIMESFAP